MRTGRNNKNGGFSLVELIIVVAIMAIVVGVMGLSVGTLTGRKIAKCADEIVSTLERARVLTLGKEQNQVEFVLLQDSSTGEYRAQIYQGGNLVSNRIVGKTPIEIEIEFSDGSTAQLGSIEGEPPYSTIPKTGLHLVFDRSSGAFSQNTNKVGLDAKLYCNKITVTNGTRTITITTVGRTGKILKK